MVNVLGSDKVPEMIANLNDGKCVAAVIMKDAWDRQLVVDPTNCKKKSTCLGLFQVYFSPSLGAS